MLDIATRLDTYQEFEASIYSECHRAAEATGLTVTWIQTAQELTSALENGLIELYQAAFSAPPYNEAFTPDAVQETFDNILNADGLLFMAATSTGQAVAFIASTPLKSEPDIEDLLWPKVDTRDASYFAEDGVAISWRRKGISSAMKKLLLNANFKAGYDSVILRTSIYNYPQLSAVNKSGGVVIPHIIQKVSSERVDGSSVADKRCFYQFKDDWETVSDASLCVNEVVIVRPGGNDTALIYDGLDHGGGELETAKKLHAAYPGIEQIMRTQHKSATSPAIGRMAGGEFCGNATRALGYVELEGQDGTITLDVTHPSRPLCVSVFNGQAKTEIPVSSRAAAVPCDGVYQGCSMVDLDGIKFLVTEPGAPLGKDLLLIKDEHDQKATVKRILKDVRLIESEASGIAILSRKTDGKLHLDPFVYVRDLDQLYYETACGTGSAAAAILVARLNNCNIDNLEVMQPSGMSLFVSVTMSQQTVLSASVNGPVDVLYRGKLHLSNSMLACG